MPILTLGAVFGFLAVGLGAFGAHGLEGRLTEKAEAWWQTATLYALVHAAVITGLGLARKNGLPGLDFPAGLMAIGILLFSGSLYAMALGAPRWFGAITPLGGLSFLAGWAFLAWIGLRGG